MGLQRGDTITVLLSRNEGEVEIGHTPGGCVFRFRTQSGVSLSVDLSREDAEDLAGALSEAVSDAEPEPEEWEGGSTRSTDARDNT